MNLDEYPFEIEFPDAETGGKYVVASKTRLTEERARLYLQRAMPQLGQPERGETRRVEVND